MIAAAAPASTDDTGWEWARVVAHGQKVHVGRTREDGSELHIQIPIAGDPVTHGWRTVWVPRAKVVFFSPITRDEGLRANRPADNVVPFNDEVDPSQARDGFGAS